MALKLKQIDVSKPLEAYDEVLGNAKNQGREPNTADRMLAMRAAILAYEADKKKGKERNERHRKNQG